MDEQQWWAPPLSKKQEDVFNCYKRYVLCCGGRRNGKTIAVGHKVFRHLWETPGARVALIATTIKSAKEGGAFADLTEIIAPIWMDSGMVGKGGLPIAYTSCKQGGEPGPVTDAATRTSRFKIRNWHGGESELLLFSIDNENEIEAITKSKRFSMVWLSEGSNFKSNKVFKNVVQMLRMMHLKKDQHQLIIDTNPAEEGDEHWLYQKWFKERLLDTPPEKLKESLPPDAWAEIVSDWPNYRSKFELFEFQLEDNPFLDRDEIIELKATNCENQGEYDRNVLGKWVKGFGLKGKVFADIVDVTKHFLGGPEDMIELDAATITLLTGWDPGQVNYAGSIVEKRICNGLPIYNLIDEVVLTDERIGTAEFAYQMHEKMKFLEQYYQKRFLWKHWADSTVFDWRASSETYDAAIIKSATGGEVDLTSVDKPKESVRTGIRIMRRCFFENRLFIGGNCPKHQEMIIGITDNDIEEDTALKHPFDSLRYVLYMEERSHYMEGKPNTVAKGIIHVT